MNGGGHGEYRARIPPCGFANIRRTKDPLNEIHHTQGKCANCGRRPQLHEGNTVENPINKWEYHTHLGGEERPENGMVWRRNGVEYRSRSRTGPPDIQGRKEWAEKRRDDLNQAWLSTHSNTLEHQAESLEHGGEILEC